MPNLLQATKFTNKSCKLNKEELKDLKNFNELNNLKTKANKLLGEDISELVDKIDNKLQFDSNKIRKKYWQINKNLPVELFGMQTINGNKFDQYSSLSLYPQTNISQLRKLADLFNLIILPVEYTEVDKLFDLQDNKEELKKSYKFFNNLLSVDSTCDYKLYLLCPINYYNVWEQIKSDVIENIYYPSYFDNIFTTLELMIPAQKNLYIATKTNTENIRALSDSFNKGIEMLNNKISNISEKVNKLEVDYLQQQMQIHALQENQQEQNDKINKLNSRINNQNSEINDLKNRVKETEEIAFRYMDLDPILFAIPKENDIIKDDVNAIMGLCWGKDIEEIVFKLKNVPIIYNSLNDINPVNIKDKCEILENNYTLREFIQNKYITTKKINNKKYKLIFSNNISLAFQFECSVSYYDNNYINQITLYHKNKILEKITERDLKNGHSSYNRDIELNGSTSEYNVGRCLNDYMIYSFNLKYTNEYKKLNNALNSILSEEKNKIVNNLLKNVK